MSAPPATSPPTLRQQAAWLFIAKALGLTLTIAFPIVLVRLLNQTEYGYYRQGFLLLTTALAVLTFNYQFSTYYYFPQGPERRLAAAWNVVLFEGAAGVAALAALTLWPRSVAWILGGDELVGFAPVFGLILLFQCQATMLEHFATADQNVRLSTLFIIGANISRGAILLGVALLDPRVGSLFAAALAQAILQSVVFLLYLRSSYRRCWAHFDRAFCGEQFFYVLPMALNALLWLAQTQAHSYVVSHQFTAAEFAIYAVGCFQVPFSGLVRESLGTVLIPRVSLLKIKGDTAEIRRLLAAASGTLALVNCGIVGLLLALGDDTIRFLFSDRYLASWPIFAVNLVCLLIEIPIADPPSRAYSRIQGRILRLRLVFVPLSTFLMAAFARRLGLVFVIAVAVGTLLVERVLICVWTAQVIGFPVSERARWRVLPATAAVAALAALAAAGSRSLLADQHLLLRLSVTSAVFAGLYVTLVWRIGLLPESDKSHIRGLLARLRILRAA